MNVFCCHIKLAPALKMNVPVVTVTCLCYVVIFSWSFTRTINFLEGVPVCFLYNDSVHAKILCLIKAKNDLNL